MKKKIMIIAAAAVVVIAFLFLFLREKPFEDRLQQTLGSLNSYLLEGVMEVAEGEDTKSYDVSVKYLKQDDQDYFRVAMKDSGMDQEQEIIRNAEGVFVVTPTLNQIFKFQGNWPSNSLKPYLLQSMREIAADESAQIEQTEEGYQISAGVNYPNNRNFTQQEMVFSDDLKIKSVQIFDDDHVLQMKMLFSKVDYEPGLTAEDFQVPQQLEKETAAEPITDEDLPLMPMETFGAVLSNSSVVENDGKVQYVLEYTGEKNFTIVEEVAESEETTQTIIMSGSLVDGLNMVGRYDGNHMTSVINSVRYTIYSDDVSEEEVRRGDVFYANLSPVVGSEQGGTRPVVIVQNDKGNRYSKTVIVAPVSKQMSKPPIPTHVIFSAAQLSHVSMILCEQLRTIDKSRLLQWICRLDEQTLERVGEAIRVSLHV